MKQAPLTLKLTALERARLGDAADVPVRAVLAAIKHYGRQLFWHLSDDAMLSTAVLAVMEAPSTYDPTTGTTSRNWAFYGAIRALLNEARDEHKHYGRVLAVLRAGLTIHAVHVDERIEIGVDGVDELTAKLDRAGDGFYARALLELAASDPPVMSDAEEELALHEAAVWAGDVLRKALASFDDAQRTVLALRFTKHKPLREIATQMGVPPPRYSTFVRRFHDLIAAVGVRLRELGMIDLPPWSSDLSGTALGP